MNQKGADTVAQEEGRENKNYIKPNEDFQGRVSKVGSPRGKENYHGDAILEGLD